MSKLDEAPVMLITGGTGSIGSEICRQALAGGWRVIIQGRSRQSVDASMTALKDNGYARDRVAAISLDIREVDSAAEKIIQQASACFQRIDALVDCLATGPQSMQVTGPFEQTDTAGYLPLLDYSVVLLQKLAQTALPWLKQSRGCLVSFISDAGVFPAPRQTLIGAARAASIGFIQNFAAEFSRDGLRAHCVSLSFVLETRTAENLQRANATRIEKARQRAGLGLPSPSDIAPAVLFLCGSGAKKITGQIISVNGGLNI